MKIFNILGYVFAFLFLFFMIFQTKAYSHDIYNGLINEFGSSCCNGDEEGKTGDCFPTKYRLVDKGAEFLAKDGTWVFVEEKKIQFKSIKGDQSGADAHFCAVKDRETRKWYVYCAFIVPGSM